MEKIWPRDISVIDDVGVPTEVDIAARGFIPIIYLDAQDGPISTRNVTHVYRAIGQARKTESKMLF